MEKLVFRFCEWSTKRGSTRHIYRNEDGVDVLYLKRHYVYRGKYGEIMIHQFFRGDTGELHNHPTWSFGRILVGGYWEWLCDFLTTGYDPIGVHKVWRKPGFFRWSWRPGSDKLYMNPKSYHKVELLPGDVDKGIVYTLFVMGPRTPGRRWSFWVNGNPLDFKKKFELDGTAAKQTAPEQWGKGWFPKKAQ